MKKMTDKSVKTSTKSLTISAAVLLFLGVLIMVLNNSEKISKENRTLKEYVGELESRALDIKSHRDNLESKNKKLEKEVNTLRDSNKSLEEDIQYLKKSVQDLTNELSDVKAKNGSLKKENASLKASKQSSTVSRGEVKTDGKVMYMTATAYTAYCNGCSGTTATGIDLRANPGLKVIAVDPKVIPLGSKVHVEGYGYAIAGDTGGAIKGNKIDVFIPTRGKALDWGRKQVKVTIIK